MRTEKMRPVPEPVEGSSKKVGKCQAALRQAQGPGIKSE